MEDKEIKAKPHKKFFIQKYENQNASQYQFPGSFTQSFNNMNQNTTHETMNSENFDEGMYIDHFEDDLKFDGDQENNEQFMSNIFFYSLRNFLIFYLKKNSE